MIDKLKEAFLIKEKTEYYLKNLEELKADNNIEENHYNALKDEYTKLREDANAKIFSIKAQYKKMLDTETKKLTTARLDLKYLEIRNKVGQLAKEEYLKTVKEPQRKCLDLEKKIDNFQKVINAKYSHELKQFEKFKLFGKKETTSGLADIPRIISDTHSVPKASVVEPEIASTPPVELPPPAPPPPEEPIPLPPPVVITTISEEKLPEPEPEPEPPPPPVITIINLEILPDRVEQGNQIGIIANLENGNDIDIHRVVELTIDDKVVDSCDVNLISGEKQELTFIITAQEIGEHKVMLENNTKSFAVMPKASQRK
jgi:hypothetical protein